jgi:hypothetical protein
MFLLKAKTITDTGPLGTTFFPVSIEKQRKANRGFTEATITSHSMFTDTMTDMKTMDNQNAPTQQLEAGV